ncbi:MAG: hypothetical protein LW817_05820 [Candidatus Caenarcaniphilales bacterium]|jgi:hypothetical protein|nr:hypothetical protein [Candidatus Caenarcaniphilales bacterium]
MVYNPIFEEEIERDKELIELRKAIKLRAGKDQVKDLSTKFSSFVIKHPVFTALALSAFALGSGRSRTR